MPTAFSSTSSTPRSDDSMLMLGHPVKRGFPGDGNASNSNKSRRTSPGLGRRTSSRPSWEDGYTDLTGYVLRPNHIPENESADCYTHIFFIIFDPYFDCI